MNIFETKPFNSFIDLSNILLSKKDNILHLENMKFKKIKPNKYLFKGASKKFVSMFFICFMMLGEALCKNVKFYNIDLYFRIGWDDPDMSLNQNNFTNVDGGGKYIQ